MWANFFGGGLRFHDGALPGEPEGASFRDVDGIRLRIRDVGEGPAVVLLHGFSASLDMWQRTIPALARGRRVVAMDLKGFGWSSRPAGDYSPPAQAALLWRLLDELGIREAALVGHSWGAAVALAMALQSPARVRRIALYSAWVYQEQFPPFLPLALMPGFGESLFSLHYSRGARHRLGYAFYDRRFVTPGMVRDAERGLALPGAPAAALASMRAMDFAGQQKRYSQLAPPALILWGREDRITPFGTAERLARDLRADLRSYDRCGHFPMIEAARRSNIDLRAFLEKER